MKLTVDLEELSSGYDEDSVAKLIKDAVEEEVRRFVKTLAKEILANQEKSARALVKKTATKDWRKVAKALELLESESRQSDKKEDSLEE
jgi:hypothetical protein